MMETVMKTDEELKSEVKMKYAAVVETRLWSVG